MSIFKKIKNFFPYSRRISVLNRGEVIIKNQWFDDFFGNLFWPNKPKIIGLHGGLGDVILLLPFLKRYKKQYPRRKIKVVYMDVRSDKIDPKKYGWGATRLEKTKNRRRINPIADFLENISFIDEKTGGDPTKADDYWFPDKVFRERWGRHLKPSEYNKLLFPEIFCQKDKNQASKFWHSHKLDNQFVIAFHFRRASDKIAKVYKLIKNYSKQKKIKCICLGSSLNQELPKINLKGSINLIDNYSKGVPLRTLYKIIFKCNLFIGGRGSFEHFFWLAQVPSINFIDKYALEKDQNAFGTWIPELWSQNRFKEIIRYEPANPKDIFNRLIRPYILEWLNENKEK